MTLDESGEAMPLVTAVLVCWNHERYVQAAVSSVLKQTYPNIELIVFDNGSTDGSRTVLEGLQREFGFTLVCQDNVGLVRALNQGLEMARGRYFAVLATDDVWLPEKTAIQVTYLEAHADVPLLAGQTVVIDEEGRPTGAPTVVRPGEPSFAQLMTQGNCVHGPTVMCRTEALRELGGYDERVRIEDYALVLRLTYAGRRIVVLPDVLTQYRRHATNWSRSLELDLYDVGRQYRHTPEYPGFYRLHFPMTFWYLVRHGHKVAALRVLWREPVQWTWANVGRGLLRMLIPYSLVRAFRHATGKQDVEMPVEAFVRPVLAETVRSSRRAQSDPAP